MAVWAINGGGAPIAATVALSAWRLSGERVGGEDRAVTLLPYRATELGDFATPGAEPTIVAARLVIGGEVVGRASYWPEPYKYLAIPDPEIVIERADAETIVVSAARPAKGVVLSADDDAWFDDNALDLFPDDPRRIAARGLGAGEIGVAWLRG